MCSLSEVSRLIRFIETRLEWSSSPPSVQKCGSRPTQGTDGCRHRRPGDAAERFQPDGISQQWEKG
jgi:hypothetical protein